jgi:hypothetical protein
MALLGFVFATIFAWVWLQMIEYFESDTKTENNPESNPQPYQKQVPTTDMQETTGKTRIIPLPIMWGPEKGSVSYNTASLDQNTEKTTVDDFPVTPAITVEYQRYLENDHQNFTEQLGFVEQRFEYVNVIVQGLEEMVEETEILKESESSQKSQPQMQEKPDSDERKQLKAENSKLKTDLETSARTLSLQLQEMQQLTAATNELNKKLEKASLKNDELILKLATSRNMASTSKDDCQKTESKLTKEISELKDQLNSKQKVLEEKEATLESTQQANKFAAQKVEDIHNSKQELKLALEKNLVLTSLNNQLQDEITEMKRTMEQMRADFGRISEARDATFLSAEEAKKLADDQADVNGLLQTTATQLKGEITEFESQINDLKKEKSVQLFNATTWAATESQLRNEIVNLKATIQTQNETLASMLSELELMDDKNELLNLRLESVKALLAEKLTENNNLTNRNLELESDKSLLELNNDTLKMEAEDSRIELERIEEENEQLWETREAVLQMARKSEKLAEEKVEAISEALTALQEAVKYTEEAAKTTKTERESLNSGATKIEAEPKKGTWIGKLFAKRKIPKSHYKDGYANLLETTGLNMVERAKNLQDHAKKIKAKGKALKMKAQALSRK